MCRIKLVSGHDCCAPWTETVPVDLAFQRLSGWWDLWGLLYV